MKHSTGNPTKAEAARMDKIKASVCTACFQIGIESESPEIHHLLSGNRRRGHRYTIGLCTWHHRGVPFDGCTREGSRFVYGPSLAEGSKPFRAKFGDDEALLVMQDLLIGEAA